MTDTEYQYHDNGEHVYAYLLTLVAVAILSFMVGMTVGGLLF